MSIVEKALVKVRGTEPPRKESRGSELPDPQRNPSGATDTRSAVPFYDTLPEGGISLNVSHLRELGLLPDEAMAAQVEDQLRRLKRPLLENAVGRNASTVPYGRVIMIASSIPGEGKTFCSFNLALSLARERDTGVILVDGDVRKADLTRSFGLGGRPGLVNLASSSSLTLRDVAVRTSVPRLSFIPAGQFDPLVPEIWAGKRMEWIVHQLAEADANTIAIIDSSPVLATNETQLLSYLVGQIAFVVRADSTPQSAVMEALGMLDRQAKICCVLNQAHQSVSQYRYYPDYSAESAMRSTGLDTPK